MHFTLFRHLAFQKRQLSYCFFPSRWAASFSSSSTTIYWAATTSGCSARGSTCTLSSLWLCLQKNNISYGIICWGGVSEGLCRPCTFHNLSLKCHKLKNLIWLWRFSTRASSDTFNSTPMLLQRQVSLLDRHVHTWLFLFIHSALKWWSDLRFHSCWVSSDTSLLYIIHGPICAALVVRTELLWEIQTYFLLMLQNHSGPSQNAKDPLTLPFFNFACCLLDSRWTFSSCWTSSVSSSPSWEWRTRPSPAFTWGLWGPRSSSSLCLVSSLSCSPTSPVNTGCMRSTCTSWTSSCITRSVHNHEEWSGLLR